MTCFLIVLAILLAGPAGAATVVSVGDGDTKRARGGPPADHPNGLH